ncbi:MAG: NAD-dependent epimerase/dehydratase family protein [Planctomycetes bacterium]|nr:NAD-dependent epimerase/dehydratase family protein [Planctomycetota bacterium]
MTQCLVTGGAGFIGSHLVDALLTAGQKVRVLDDFSTGNPANLANAQSRIELVRGSITQPAIVDQAVAGCAVVYHLAAVASVTKSVETPLASHDACATGTVNVLDAARRLGVRRVVFAASSSAYGDQPGDERTEDDALIPLSPYAAAKLASEHYCTAFASVFGLETVRLRFFNVFGPRQDAKSPYSGVIAIFSAHMKQGKPPTIYGDGLQARDFVYVADVVRALRLAADSKKAIGRVYNIGTGKSVNLLELVGYLNEILGTKLQPIHQPPRAGDVRVSQASIRRAREELGYEPTVSFRDGLVKLLQAPP